MLYPKIAIKEPEFAPRITGMLTDLNVFEVIEILELLEDPIALDEKIEEAKELLTSAEN